MSDPTLRPRLTECEQGNHLWTSVGQCLCCPAVRPAPAAPSLRDTADQIEATLEKLQEAYNAAEWRHAVGHYITLCQHIQALGIAMVKPSQLPTLNSQLS